MSRIGKLPVKILAGVTINVQNGVAEVVGPKGKLTVPISKDVIVTITDGQAIVTLNDPEALAIWGTTRALLNNAVIGVTAGWQKGLELVGVGFKVALKEGQSLDMSLGFSHPVIFPIPEGITVTVEANTKIMLAGIDKDLVGLTAAKIRKKRPPEPYKGKGIRYIGEVVRRKAGKSGKAGGIK